MRENFLLSNLLRVEACASTDGTDSGRVDEMRAASSTLDNASYDKSGDRLPSNMLSGLPLRFAWASSSSFFLLASEAASFCSASTMFT